MRRRLAAALLLAAVALLAGVTVRSALGWIGRPFPGFFLLPNGQVAPVRLPGSEGTMLDQVPPRATVVAVDGIRVRSPETVYAHVRELPAGTTIEYELAHDGLQTTVATPSLRFEAHDAFLVFGVYLFNGIVFAAIGIGAWALAPSLATSWALLGLGLSVSTWALTALDFYGPYSFFRLHGLAETLLPGALLHLALVFPVRRTTGRRAVLISYVPALALTAIHQLGLADRVLYSTVHGLAIAATAVAALDFLGAVLVGYLRSGSPLVRHRVRITLLGLFAGFVNPVLVLTLSVLDSGRVPVNLTGFTACVFPLAVAYAAHKRDLFEIDALLQRGMTSAVLSGFVTALYFVVGAIATQILHVAWQGESTMSSVLFSLGVLLAVPRLRDRAQRWISVVWARQSYDPQDILASASTAFGTTLRLDEIIRLTMTFPASALGLAHTAVFVRHGEGFAEAGHLPETPVRPRLRTVDGDDPLVQALLTTSRPVHHDPADGRPGDALRGTCAALEAGLVVPLGCHGTMSGFLVCGPKRAGTPFSAVDVSFLHTFANHAALALQNARTFYDLERLNADLERRVRERTQQLDASLAQLGTAYRTLEANQEQLIAAQRMASFGRLVAGIAHEVNTPLAAAMNGLHIARQLTAEAVTAGEHDRSATLGELGSTLGHVEDWIRKVAAYIRQVKGQGRAAAASTGPIAVHQLLEHQLVPLLSHRLETTDTSLAWQASPDLPELHGPADRLIQVLANLVNNAVDAGHGLPAARRRIRIDALRELDEVVIRVSDCGAGMSGETRARLFEAFYTTKPPGLGTGLGLAIARDIVCGEFGGSLDLAASDGQGTTFVLRLPAAVAAGRAAA